MEELLTIQQKLKAPKDKYNTFGKYNYRSCESILEAVKPLLQETVCTLTITDDIVYLGVRYYIKATATLTNKEGIAVSTTAFAREEETKKGMDSSQITGAASSYARKYALNGLFGIDDNKDSDATNTHDKEDARPESKTPVRSEQMSFGYTTQQLESALGELAQCTTMSQVKAVYDKWRSLIPALCRNGSEFYNAVVAARKTFQQPV